MFSSKHLLFTLFLCLLSLILLVACGNLTLPGQPKPITHVYLIVMENEGYNEIVGNAKAPFLNSLIPQYGLATQYNAITHPSQPNYLALFSGNTQGVKDDGRHDLSAPNLADQLEAKGKTWRVFAQNYPGNCFKGETASGGPDGEGTYLRKHNPAVSFANISGNAARCANITDFAHFDPGAANFVMIVPNACNDMHDCSIAEGDTFLSTLIPRLVASKAWQEGSLLFLVWDEGADANSESNQVPLFVLSTGIPAGFKLNNAYDHYSVLRTIEDLWGLGCLGEACNAKNIVESFR